jgi:glycine/serine hydroxymethyltransferase
MSNVGPMFPWSNQPLAECDPDVADLIEREKNRQWRGLELIASEVRAYACILRGVMRPVPR